MVAAPSPLPHFINGNPLINQLISTIICAMGYGIEIALFISCVQLIRGMPKETSKPMRRFLFTYTVLMFMVGTLYTTSSIVNTILRADQVSSSMALCDLCDNSYWVSLNDLCVTLVIWGADGFMLWRCVVLYNGISPGQRIAFLMLSCTLALSALG
ncbi:hypothetical protein B0H34DRAFT_504685 [Crassisporium funariophilum]|nr:hypothetical protein B0H34DRAFT_504685 [Crassisporium funariophilum]